MSAQNTFVTEIQARPHYKQKVSYFFEFCLSIDS